MSTIHPLYGGFLKCWYPTTIIRFSYFTKNDHFGVFRGYHHLIPFKETPIYNITQQPRGHAFCRWLQRIQDHQLRGNSHQSISTTPERNGYMWGGGFFNLDKVNIWIFQDCLSFFFGGGGNLIISETKSMMMMMMMMMMINHHMMNHEMISLFAVSGPKSATSPSVKLTLAKTCSTDSLVPRWTLALHGTVIFHTAARFLKREKL